ncbi:MAG TPA: hypothetical protein VHC22_33995 [Pirellulales bacterium]|nr:hypothetical protein [Pirellulales bacterium]
MLEVGSAAQTLAAFYLLTGNDPQRRTYARLQLVAEAAGLSIRTVQLHIERLIASGWLESFGREHTGQSSHRRRTTTYGLTKKAVDTENPFARLPRWATAVESWAERATLACLVSRRDVVEGQRGSFVSVEETLTVRTVCKQTGLTARSVRAAKLSLAARGWIRVAAGDPKLSMADAMALNLDAQLDTAFPAFELHEGSRSGDCVDDRTKHRDSENGPRQQSSDGPTEPPGRVCAHPRKSLRVTPGKVCARSDLEPVKRTGQKEHARRAGSDQFFQVDSEADVALAGTAFRALGYTGDDGAIIWKAAAWCRLSLLSTNALLSACHGAKFCAQRNPLGYLRRCLEESIGGPQRLGQFERSTKLPRGFVPRPPSERDMLGELGLRPQIAGPEAPIERDADARRAELRRALEAAV